MPEPDNRREIVRIEVLWKKDAWYVVLHYADKTKDDLNVFNNKEDAEARAREIGHWAADRQGSTVEARFKTKDGKIPEGEHGTATYGRDPETTKG